MVGQSKRSKLFLRALGLMTQALRIKCLKKFAPLIQKRKRTKILVGGRGSTKSTFVADYVASCVSQGQLWCCGREYQNSIDESVHRLLTDEIERLSLDGFNIGATDISHASGGRTFYKGLSRNILSLKGILSGIDGLWIEEGEGLSDATLRVLTGSVRLTAKDYDHAKLHGINLNEIKKPEIWITMNRGSRSDPIAKRYLERAEQALERCDYYEDDAVMVVQVNYPDMPPDWFAASGLEEERADDFKMLSRAQYNHKWHGGYLETVENAIIQEEWFDACIDAHLKLGFEAKGIDVVTFDPADSGDAKGLVHRKGSVIVEAIEKHDGDVNEACDWSLGYAHDVKADEYIWDADGLGLSLRRQINEALAGKKITIGAFHGQGEVTNPNLIYQSITSEQSRAKTNRETFRNKRAQKYIEVRDRCYRTYRAVMDKTYPDPATLISFSSKITHLKKLKTELCRIPRVPNGQGLIQLMSKEQMKSKGIPSPNLADPVMMSFDDSGLQSQQPIVTLKQIGWGSRG
jgi:phage terminase large subunit